MIIRLSQDMDSKFMDLALQLARKGEALTSPNPAVGAVVVKNERVVGEGFHTYDGLKHAEVVALEMARGAARGATLYVNLEPCCHTGRTGPCTDAIIRAGVKRVVAAMRDPNPRVAGRGFELLRRAGIHVQVGVGESAAQRLNEAFARWIRSRRPLVTLKSALTLDGQIAAPARKGTKRTVTWITSEESRAEVQRMRHASDALLTGIGTVLADDPRMTDRTGLPRRRPLLRVVVDSQLRLPLKSKLVRSAAGDLLVFTAQNSDSPKARALRKAGVEVARVGVRKGKADLRAIVKELGRREILSVLLEAGPGLNGASLQAGIVDKMVLFYAPKVMGAGVPVVAGGGALPAMRDLRLRRFGEDFCVEGYLRDVYRNR